MYRTVPALWKGLVSFTQVLTHSPKHGGPAIKNLMQHFAAQMELMSHAEARPWIPAPTTGRLRDGTRTLSFSVLVKLPLFQAAAQEIQAEEGPKHHPRTPQEDVEHEVCQWLLRHHPEANRANVQRQPSAIHFRQSILAPAPDCYGQTESAADHEPFPPSVFEAGNYCQLDVVLSVAPDRLKTAEEALLHPQPQHLNGL